MEKAGEIPSVARAVPSRRGRPALLLLGAVLLSVGCTVDEPVCFVPRGGTAPAQRLSQLGLFDDLRSQRAASGVVPYTVAVALYSDGASKHRFLSPPPGTELQYRDERWVLPVGTRLIKTFYFPLDARDPAQGETLIETRILEQTDAGIRKGTYRWNAEQTDALCSGGNEDVSVPFIDAAGGAHQETFHIPGTTRCDTCHQSGAESRALGIRARQMNVDGGYDDGTTNQIDHLVLLGALDTAPPPATRPVLSDPFGSAPLSDRATSYLDVNCGSCHSADGYAAGTGVDWDLGHAQDAFCRPTASVDGRDRVIVPGHPEASEFLARMNSSDPFLHMPQWPDHSHVDFRDPGVYASGRSKC